VTGAYPEADELLFCLKFLLSKLLGFEIIGIKWLDSGMEQSKWGRDI
jgi:hypothetical protein